jgi:hypothetical protein
MIKIDRMTQSGQIYLIPTIRVTHDKFLYGFYNIEFWWLKWGFEIILNKMKH